MRLTRAAVVSVLVGLLCSTLGAADRPAAAAPDNAPPTVAGKIDRVTVYRGQALVTRLVEVGGGAALREVVVTNLPEQIVPESIYAEAAEGVEVRSVSYRVRPLAQDAREEVRKLDEQVRQTEDKIAGNQKQTQVLAEQKGYLEKLAAFTAPTAQVEMSKGVLNAETLQKLTTFQFDSSEKIAQQELKLAQELRGLNEALQLLQRQRGELANSSARTAREALVFLSVPGKGGKFRLRYLVNEASWSPSYNIRTAADRKQVTVEYLAAIQQMSGEDWTGAAMTLSTATPSLTAKAPELAPLTIALVARSGPTGTGMADFEKAKQEIVHRQAAA